MRRVRRCVREKGALTALANALRAKRDALAQWQEEAGQREREEAACQRQAQVDECAGHRGELVRQAAELKRLLSRPLSGSSSLQNNNKLN